MDQSSAPLPSMPAEVPSPPADGRGVVVWHREHLRTDDHLPLARASAADAVLPVFVFDPAFYGEDGLACDAVERGVENEQRQYRVGGRRPGQR